ncbi:glycosyltransferase family 39 protein [Leptospira harrisiae]|uniref:Dolichyl-phosphate-mannose--protein mannosyltransferase n=1 Tax=Leptospira harrisiae TaxID=2023189 RepID=A0A2N0APQ6_9LEPT|nr:dolichyl-phosphate-mannose--protein mannosyltransferase [Leptospira harrisiae]PJZ86260.1 dolichyl-phosphate-mannose--protein mannosyltransferase [Leptospira harrisiae]PKA09826.1 dolichyl-phosphate-mannose--protein mannosyltransferase [Leptospira harrisiae]
MTNRYLSLLWKIRIEVGIAVSILLGIFLRLFKIDRQSLWGDEFFSVYASSLTEWSDFWSYIDNDPHPPLFQILLSLWIKFLPSFTEIGVKIFPVIISILNLILIFLLTKHWESLKRFLFIFFLSLSPGAIYYSQEVRSYSLLLCLTSVIVVLIHNLEYNKAKVSNWVFIGLLSVLTSYVHLFGFIFVSSLFFVYWLLSFRNRDQYAVRFFTLGILTSITFLPFIFHLAQSAKIETASWIDSPNLVLFLTYYTLFYATSKKIFIFTMVIPISVFTYWVIKVIRNLRERTEHFFFSNSTNFLLVAAFIIFSTLLFSFYKPIVTNRNWIVTLPLLYLFAADQMKGKFENKYLVILFFLISLLSLFEFKKNFYTSFKEDWRGTAKYISSNCAKPIVLTDSFPEFLSVYLRWNHSEGFQPLILRESVTISQSNICVVNRQIGGNGLHFSSNPNFVKVKDTILYGFTIEEYEKNK